MTRHYVPYGRKGDDGPGRGVLFIAERPLKEYNMDDALWGFAAKLCGKRDLTLYDHGSFEVYCIDHLPEETQCVVISLPVKGRILVGFRTDAGMPKAESREFLNDVVDKFVEMTGMRELESDPLRIKLLADHYAEMAKRQ